MTLGYHDINANITIQWLLLRESVSGHLQSWDSGGQLPCVGVRICRHSCQRHPVSLLSRARTVSVSHRVASFYYQETWPHRFYCRHSQVISPADILSQILTALLMTVKTFTEYLCGKLLKCDAFDSHWLTYGTLEAFNLTQCLNVKESLNNKLSHISHVRDETNNNPHISPKLCVGQTGFNRNTHILHWRIWHNCIH